MAEDGAPIAKDAIDPELIKLKRARPKIGVVTAAGLVFLCAIFLLRLNPDRRFSSADDKPTRVAVADVLAGNVAEDRYVSLEAEPLVSHAIRSTSAKGSLGLRVVPVRGTNDKLWIVLPGDGWEKPALNGYEGRLRKLGDLPFAASVHEFADKNPRPLFATADAVRAAAGGGKVTTVTGDQISPAASDRVEYDVVDANIARIVCTFNEHLPNTAAWAKALEEAGIHATLEQAGAEIVRFTVTMPDAVAATTKLLEYAARERLEHPDPAHPAPWAARVEPVANHVKLTWHEIAAQPLPEGVDLVAMFSLRGIPDDAYALITSERPADYWYVLPVSIALAAILLVFAWALVRAIKRDLMPTAVR